MWHVLFQLVVIIIGSVQKLHNRNKKYTSIMRCSSVKTKRIETGKKFKRTDAELEEVKLCFHKKKLCPPQLLQIHKCQTFSGVFLGGLLSSFLTFVIAQSVDWALSTPGLFKGSLCSTLQEQEVVQRHTGWYLLFRLESV